MDDYIRKATEERHLKRLKQMKQNHKTKLLKYRLRIRDIRREMRTLQYMIESLCPHEYSPEQMSIDPCGWRRAWCTCSLCGKYKSIK